MRRYWVGFVMWVAGVDIAWLAVASLHGALGATVFALGLALAITGWTLDEEER